MFSEMLMSKFKVFFQHLGRLKFLNSGLIHCDKVSAMLKTTQKCFDNKKKLLDLTTRCVSFKQKCKNKSLHFANALRQKFGNLVNDLCLFHWRK
jgi:hypothetical protein